jgi:hypothetical protein
MTPRSRLLVLPWLVLALLLQAHAVVRSVTMNAPGAMPMCDMPMGNGAMGDGAMGDGAGMDMAGMAAMPMGRHHAPKGGAQGRLACPYCAAAAHVPIIGSTPTVRPSLSVAYAAFCVLADHGPRGPPTIQPRARGPPLSA